MNNEALVCGIAFAVLVVHWLGIVSGACFNSDSGESGGIAHAITLVLTISCVAAILVNVGKTLYLVWFP